jgi:hypothetical protein
MTALARLARGSCRFAVALHPEPHNIQIIAMNWQIQHKYYVSMG